MIRARYVRISRNFIREMNRWLGKKEKKRSVISRPGINDGLDF